ncbi:MAG: hypothetical protein MJZ20_14260 [Bacteroidaceae bacterium]|nr:hypothetical protein [Bacteroidaceae bacterium]
MVTKKLDDYDVKLLKTAREMICAVYEYNHGDVKLQRQVGRLETILTRLDSLIQMENGTRDSVK